MKTRSIVLVTMTLAMFCAGSAHASVVTLWSCTLNESKTNGDLMEASSIWLDAAKKNEGGGEAEVYIEYPIVGNAGAQDFTFVFVLPDTKAWGSFNHNYPETPAGKAEAAWGEVATCLESSMWWSEEVE